MDTNGPPSDSPKVVLPLRDQWPPVIRPPIQGKAKIIEDQVVTHTINVVKAREVEQPKEIITFQNLGKYLMPLLNE